MKIFEVGKNDHPDFSKDSLQLPALKGSEKQIAYANDLRAKCIDKYAAPIFAEYLKQVDYFKNVKGATDSEIAEVAEYIEIIYDYVHYGFDLLYAILNETNAGKVISTLAPKSRLF